MKKMILFVLCVGFAGLSIQASQAAFTCKDLVVEKTDKQVPCDVTKNKNCKSEDKKAVQASEVTL